MAGASEIVGDQYWRAVRTDARFVPTRAGTGVLSCGMLSCGMLNCGMLSCGMLSCGLLSCGMLSCALVDSGRIRHVRRAGSADFDRWDRLRCGEQLRTALARYSFVLLRAIDTRPHTPCERMMRGRTPGQMRGNQPSSAAIMPFAMRPPDLALVVLCHA